MTRYQLGATYLGDGRCQFLVWAPKAERVEVHIQAPSDCTQLLTREECGYYRGVLENVYPGALYAYRLDGGEGRPDPASRHQPSGVHGPSEVVDPHAFVWGDAGWKGVPQHELVIYEMHVGTFSPAGTFDSAIPYLDELKDLGITAVEVLPVNAFPEERNWGYDGVLPFAVQHSYGGPEGFRRFVDACHQRGLGVILDIVYNHLGPEGNYLAEFGHYFTGQHLTPWGSAINFDGNHSDEVRKYFIQNGIYWLTEYHLDGFRLDAIHAIYDQTSTPFLEEWTAAVQRRGEERGARPVIIAESMMNDPKVIQPAVVGGFGMDAEWNDDFHHALHVLLTGERTGYYRDYSGVTDLAKAFRQGYVYTGEHMTYRGRRHGRVPHNTEARQFLAYSQTHDQVGNHAGSARLSGLIDFERLKLAAGAVMLSPFIPMLFMGEEYGETNPWWYFVDHRDPDLLAAVREGRNAEFAGFDWGDEIADPGAEASFFGSKLQHHLKQEPRHKSLRRWYQELIRARRAVPALRHLSFEQQQVIAFDLEQVLLVHRWHEGNDIAALFSFAEQPVTLRLPFPAGTWTKRLDSTDEQWQGNGSEIPGSVRSTGAIELTLGPHSCVLFERVVKEQ